MVSHPEFSKPNAPKFLVWQISTKPHDSQDFTQQGAVSKDWTPS
jgi:hypothetical protein